MFANFLSFCCTICFGVGNYLNAIVSAKYGVKAVFMMFPGLFILWVIYHTFTMCRLKKGFKEYLADSEYRNKQTNAIEMWRIRTPIIRCIIQASIQVILAICFFFWRQSSDKWRNYSVNIRLRSHFRGYYLLFQVRLKVDSFWSFRDSFDARLCGPHYSRGLRKNKRRQLFRRWTGDWKVGSLPSSNHHYRINDRSHFRAEHDAYLNSYREWVQHRLGELRWQHALLDYHILSLDYGQVHLKPSAANYSWFFHNEHHYILRYNWSNLVRECRPIRESRASLGHPRG